MTAGNKAPAPLRIIAWLAIAMGISLALQVCGVLLTFAEFSSALMSAAPMLAVAVAVLWAGIGLLRLQAWARMAIQILCWLFGISLVTGVVTGLAMSQYTALSFIDWVGFAYQMAVLLIAIIVTLRYLRGPQARAAVAGLDVSLSEATDGRHRTPAPLRIIAWLSIVMSIGLALGAIRGVLIPESPPPAGNTFESMGFMAAAYGNIFLKNIPLASAVQCAAAVIWLWAGIDLLRLRAWARSAIQVFCWLYVAFWEILFPVLWWANVRMNPAGHEADATPSFAMVQYVVAAVFYVMAAAVIQRYLRSPQARAAAGR